LEDYDIDLVEMVNQLGRQFCGTELTVLALEKTFKGDIILAR
jgi:hypothetical protein